MDKTERDVTPMFSMDIEKLRAHQETMRQFPVDPAILRVMLNSGASDVARGRGMAVLGLIGVVLELVVASLCWFYGLGGVTIAIFIGLAVVSAGVAWVGLQRQRTAEKVLRRSADARMELEGDQGFLWRFEPILMGVDIDSPEFGMESLRAVCQESKQLASVVMREELYEYWYWASLLKSALEIIPVEGQTTHA